jgi:glyoxylase-like metal-dependent hydrolase (beta-lactamase superfamily II)
MDPSASFCWSADADLRNHQHRPVKKRPIHRRRQRTASSGDRFYSQSGSLEHCGRRNNLGENDFGEEVIRLRLAIVLPIFLTIFFAKNSFSQQTTEPLRPEWCRQLPRLEYAKLERVLRDESWFEVYRIRPGVFAIYEPKQFEEVISYLILGDKRALLFDTGLGVGRISATVARLTTLPITVINSHTHFDHVGGNAEFHDIWNLDLPFTQQNQRGETNAYSKDTLAPERLCGALPKDLTSRPYSIRPWKSTHSLQDGESIDLGGRQLEIIFTPGHTPDSLSLLDRDNGLLFTGDTFYPGPIYLFTPETDVAAYTQSVAKLAALEPKIKLLLPAHNAPVAEPLYLNRLADAVQQVHSGKAKYISIDGHREYSFDGFSILLTDTFKSSDTHK